MKQSARLFATAALGVLCSLSAHANPIASGFNSNTLPANDDGSTGPVVLPFTLNFFGVTSNSVFVNNNGNVTFTAPLSQYTPSGLGSSPVAIIAPFFADVDTRGAGSGLVTYGTGTYAGEQAFGVNYPDVGYYFEHTNKLDDFQLLLVDRSDVGAGDFDIYFNYGSMQFETGDASGGNNGLGGSCAGAGYSNGTGAGTNQVTYELPGSRTCGALIDGGPDALSANTNDGVTGQFLFQARNGQVVTPVMPMGATPEPSTLALFGTGVLGIATRLRRRAVA